MRLLPAPWREFCRPLFGGSILTPGSNLYHLYLKNQCDEMLSARRFPTDPVEVSVVGGQTFRIPTHDIEWLQLIRLERVPTQEESRW